MRQALVAGGTTMKSRSYRLVLTTGESLGGDAVMSSPRYRLVAGVVGQHP